MARINKLSVTVFFIIAFIAYSSTAMDPVKLMKNCIECQKIHHKCDKAFPCGHCRATHKTCTPDTNIRKRGRPVGSTNKSKKSKQALGNKYIENAIPNAYKIIQNEDPLESTEEKSPIFVESIKIAILPFDYQKENPHKCGHDKSQEICCYCKTATTRQILCLDCAEEIYLCEACNGLSFETD